MRLAPAGSVDDGKSTLIGRLLHDTRQVFDDQLSAVATDSRRWGTTGEVPDLALLVERSPGSATAASFRALTGSDDEYAAWQTFYDDCGRLAPPAVEHPGRGPEEPPAGVRALVGGGG